MPLQNGRNLERVDAHVRPVKRSESDGSLNMQILLDRSTRGVLEAIVSIQALLLYCSSRTKF